MLLDLDPPRTFALSEGALVTAQRSDGGTSKPTPAKAVGLFDNLSGLKAVGKLRWYNGRKSGNEVTSLFKG